MKFASYSDGSRDGQLVLVSRDLTQAHYATHIATRLQAVLEDWNFLAPQLQDVYDNLNAGHTRHAFAFDPARCMAPLPRSFHHVQAHAYPAFGRLVHGGDAASDAAESRDHIVHSGDALWGPHAVVAPAHAALGLDFESFWGVVTADLPVGATPERALEGVRLVLLGQNMVLRHAGRVGAGLHLGSAFAPVALTPDELGEGWHRGRLQATMVTHWNGRKVGMADTAADMPAHTGKLLSQLAAWRPLTAGTLVTLGPVSNQGSGADAVTERPKGFHSIAEKRALEMAQHGQASTAYLQAGDDVRSDARSRDGTSLFGVVSCEVGASPDGYAGRTP